MDFYDLASSHAISKSSNLMPPDVDYMMFFIDVITAHEFKKMNLVSAEFENGLK